MAPVKPYGGPTRKLVLGIDVGTTYSGISYAILDPGEVPKIQGVTRYVRHSLRHCVVADAAVYRFPGQENAAGDSKIPTILYYRADGTVHSAGAEAAVPGIELDAEDEDLFLSKWCVLSSPLLLATLSLPFALGSSSIFVPSTSTPMK